MSNDFRELVATLCYDQWAEWMKYILAKSKEWPGGSIVIPPDLAERWKRQMSATYDNLPENEKDSNRAEADKFINLFANNGKEDK